MHRLNSIDSEPGRQQGCCPASPQEPNYHPLWGWVKSHQVLLQAIIVWMLVCMPYNVVTLVLYNQVSASSSETVLVTGNNMTGIEMKDPESSLESNFCGLLNEDPSCFTHANVTTQCLSIIQQHVDWGPYCQDPFFSPECVLQHFQLDLLALIGKCKLYGKNENETAPQPNYTCHEPIDNFNQWVVNARFWLEGVAVIVVGIFGMAGNALTVLVLRRIETNVMFNKLLMSLAIFDSLYLLYYIVDHGIIGTFMRSLGPDWPEPLWYRVSYPYILCPLKWMFMSCTIFMVVAISAERHRAICSPLTHRPTFWPYVLMVVCTACTFNIPKFFEFEIKKNANGEYDYETTALNESKAYIVFCSWWVDLIVFGIVPLVSLVVFNLKIYLKVRSSDRLEYRFVGRKTQLSRKESATLHFRSSKKRSITLGKKERCEEIEMVDMKELANSLDEAYGFSKANVNSEKSKTPTISTAASFRFPTKDQRNFPTKRNTAAVATGESMTGSAGKWQANGHRLEDQIETLGHEGHEEEEISFVNIPTGTVVQGDTPTSLINSQGRPQHFQKRREKSARILITIVLTFLFCHTFRFVIKVYEVTHPSHSTVEHHIFCEMENKKFHVPVILLILQSLSHFLLVVNSSINFIIYCCVGKRFRAELKELVHYVCRKICQACCNSHSEDSATEAHVMTLDE